MPVLAYVEGNGGVKLGGSSSASTDVTFTPGNPNSVATGLVVEWDFDNDGTFAGGVEDVTGYVLDLSTANGRDRASHILGRAVAGRLDMLLDNTDGRFSYFNTDSPLNAGDYSLKTGRRLRVRRDGTCSVLDLTGASGSCASTPDAARFDITGDITLAADVALDDWTPATVQSLLSKWNSTGNQRSYDFQVATSGLPRLVWSPDGTAAASITSTATAAPPGLTAGSRCPLKVTLDVNNGAAGHTATYYYKPHPDYFAWIRLGDPVTTAGVTSIHSGTAVVNVGARQAGTEQMVSGSIFRAWVDNSTPAEVADVDFRPQTAGAATVVDDYGTTFTINSPATLAAGDDWVEPDPTLLVQDTFVRADNEFIGTAETGQSYVEPVGVDHVIAGNQVAAGFESAESLAVVDLGGGRTDYYAQIRVTALPCTTTGATESTAGLVYRYQDTNDFSVFRVKASTGVELVDVVAGVETVQATYDPGGAVPCTLGVQVEGGNVWGYFNGIAVVTATAIQTDETEVGFRSTWGDGSWRPTMDDFFVWDRMPVEGHGVAWAGEVTSVMPRTTAGPHATVRVAGEGALARAARFDTTPFRCKENKPTGHQIGHYLSAADALHPPPVMGISLGARLCSPLGYDEEKGKALALIEPIEAYDGGLVFEQPEGRIDFHDYSALNDPDTSPVLIMSDAGGLLTYESIEMLDWSREVVNRARLGIGPSESLFSITGSYLIAAQSPVGATRNITVTVPSTVENGDLCVFIVSSSTFNLDNEWERPIWWVEERDCGAAPRQRVYTHISDGTDGGDNVTFYDDTHTAGGAYVGAMVLVRADEWFGTHEGIHVGRWAGSVQPAPIEMPWGSEPTLLLVIRMGCRGSGAKTITGTQFPVGFVSFQDHFEDHTTVPGFDVAQMVGARETIEPVFVPDQWGGTFTGFDHMESGLIAIRSRNGSPPVKSGRQQRQYDHKGSQRDHGGNIFTLNDPPQIVHYVAGNGGATVTPGAPAFTLPAERYAHDIFKHHADDRPRFKVGFTASKNAVYRGHALYRKVGDKVRLVASGNATLGAEGEFYIESVDHRVSNGRTLWRTEWTLSPAAT